MCAPYHRSNGNEEAPLKEGWSRTNVLCMTQTPKYILQAFGATLFVVLLAVFVWSLTRPPVSEGPMPPMLPFTNNPISN